MGLMDKLQHMMGMPDDEFYDEYDEEMDEVAPEPQPAPSAYSEPDDLSFMENTPKRNKVVNIHATTQLQVVLVKPEHFEDASTIADPLTPSAPLCLTLKQPAKRFPAG